jgi:hypothetical protein
MKGTEMKATQIPEKFKLFGQNWTIRQATELEVDGDLGLCVVDDNLILYDGKQTEQSRQHTILHEVVHAVEQKLHLNLTEQQVDLIALGLLEVFTHTPEMMNLFKQGVDNGKR